MSYTQINGMRSARYPLQGMGCGCNPLGADSSDSSGSGTATTITAVVLGSALLYVLFKKKPMSTNRRRR